MIRSLGISLLLSAGLRGIERLFSIQLGWWGVLLGIVVAVLVRAHDERADAEEAPCE